MTILEWQAQYPDSRWLQMTDSQKASAYSELLRCWYDEYSAHPSSASQESIELHRSIQASIEATRKAIYDHVKASLKK